MQYGNSIKARFRSVKQNKEFRNKSMRIRSTDLQQSAKNTQWERMVSSINSIPKTGFPYVENKIESLSQTM